MKLRWISFWFIGAMINPLTSSAEVSPREAFSKSKTGSEDLSSQVGTRFIEFPGTKSYDHLIESDSQPALRHRLEALKDQILRLETQIMEGESSPQAIRNRLQTIKKLESLQKKETKIGQKRLEEIEVAFEELEQKKKHIEAEVTLQKAKMFDWLVSIEQSSRISPVRKTTALPKHEKMESPRRQLMVNLTDFGIKKLEILKAELSDTLFTQERVLEEKQVLNYLLNELVEKLAVLELNRKLQIDLLKQRHADQLGHLTRYRNLKRAESRVEGLINQFNARMELKRIETDQSFVSQKGNLPLPIKNGEIVAKFGRVYDPDIGLHVFKKGIDIQASPNQRVEAIFPGRVAFSGVLPNYGNVVIVDHGDHYYSLFGQLGKIRKRTDEQVALGDEIGVTKSSGTPLYFEIRSKNVAVNPLQWIIN